MLTPYRQSWRTHPGFNILFVCAMLAAWGMYALLYATDLPWGSNQANGNALRHHGGNIAALAAQRAGNHPAKRPVFLMCRRAPAHAILKDGHSLGVAVF